MLQIGAAPNECVFLAVIQNKGWCHIKINDTGLLFLSFFANEFAFYVYLIRGCLRGFSSANATHRLLYKCFLSGCYYFIYLQLIIFLVVTNSRAAFLPD